MKIIKEFVEYLITETKNNKLQWKRTKCENEWYSYLFINNRVYVVLLHQESLENYVIQLQCRYSDGLKQIGPTFYIEYDDIRDLLSLVVEKREIIPLTSDEDVEEYLKSILCN